MTNQEYGARIECFTGEINTGADGLLRLPFNKSTTSEAFNDLFSLKSSNLTLKKLFPLDLQHIGKEQETDEEQHIKSKLLIKG